MGELNAPCSQDGCANLVWKRKDFCFSHLPEIVAANLDPQERAFAERMGTGKGTTAEIAEFFGMSRDEVKAIRRDIRKKRRIAFYAIKAAKGKSIPSYFRSRS